MASRWLHFDLARLDGTNTGPHSATVSLSLRRPQQDNDTTVTTVPYMFTVAGPTRVEVPVTAPGNALCIGWPAYTSTASRTWHVIPEGFGDLVAAEMPRVDPSTLAVVADPEPAWWAALESATGSASSPILAASVDAADHTVTLTIGA